MMYLKNILIYLVLILLPCSVMGQYRYANLRVAFSAPAPLSVIYSPETINFSFKIYNQGPDTIFPTDTLIYRPGHTFNISGKAIKRVPFPRILAPGDSMEFSDTILVNEPKGKDTIELFFSYNPLSYGPDAGKLYLQSEFFEDQSNNRPVLELLHVGFSSAPLLSTDPLKIYPNPLISGSLSIAGLTDPANTTVVVYDMQMNQCIRKQHFSYQQTITLNCDQLSSGIYLVHIREGDHEYFKKLIIQ